MENVLGLKAVAVHHDGVKRPAEFGVREDGEEEGADELSVSEPDRDGGVESLDGEQVDEDGLRALEENVERCGVFEDPAFGNEVGAEVEGKGGRAKPERGRPLPGKGPEGDE